MAARLPADPPVLPGYEAIELIGSGGYADVFLYRQARPERLVAVKVLVADALSDGAGASDFTAEANLMAKVSSHPYIVQVFQADIAPDGRPYLAMEYYPGPNYYDRARREQMAVAEVLRTGIQLSSAVETAHRAGIFHRDIKPANVLTSEFHRPGLTDFGIASAQGPGEDITEGVSIPWAPPEAFGATAPDVRGDVYSLAATIYTLLVGRSPFEVPSGDNSALSLIGRIDRNPLPSLGRADVPPSFERILSVAMSKDPSHRPASAAELARQLQSVESELKLAVTPLELAGEARSFRSRSTTEAEPDHDSTRIKQIKEFDAQPSALIRSTDDKSASSSPPPPRRREGLLASPVVEQTVTRAPQGGVSDVDRYAPPAIRRTYLWVGGAVAAAALVVGGSTLLRGSDDPAPAKPAAAEFAVNDDFDAPIATAPVPLAEVLGVAGDSTNTFTWSASSEAAGYIVTEINGGGPERINETTVNAPVECVEVAVVAESGLISAATRGCVGSDG